MRKDQLAYSDEAIPNLIIKGEKGENVVHWKGKIKEHGGGEEVGRKRKERKRIMMKLNPD